jgi:hypothetical protein
MTDKPAALGADTLHPDVTEAETSVAKSWRDVLKVHPAAELFPLMSVEELKVLGEDIKANGVTAPLALFLSGDAPPMLLDGRNRLDAMEAVGVDVASAISRWAGGHTLEVHGLPAQWVGCVHIHNDRDPYAYVISANVHRRHLTPEQKRDLIAKLIDLQPEKSDREISRQVKASPTTVGKARQLSKRGQLVKRRTGKDGKSRRQPTHKARKAADGQVLAPAQAPEPELETKPAHKASIKVEASTSKMEATGDVSPQIKLRAALQQLIGFARNRPDPIVLADISAAMLTELQQFLDDLQRVRLKTLKTEARADAGVTSESKRAATQAQREPKAEPDSV